MNTTVEFSKPVVIDEGVAFRVRLPDGSQRVAVATKARLGIGNEAQGLALLAAFTQASIALFVEAAQFVQSGVVPPVFYL